MSSRAREHFHDHLTTARRALDELRQHISDHPARTLTYDPTRDDLAERAAKAAADLTDGEYRPPYNGHRNRETWNASLWIDNDQGTYEAAREIIRDACAGSDYDTRGVYTREQDRRYQLTYAGDALRDWYEERYAPADTASPLADAWGYAVAVADWARIAEGIAEGMDPDPTLHPQPERSAAG